MEISKIEIGALANFFNQDGFVLDFSTANFDAFTLESVGVALCSTYKVSKGKSLMAYINSATQENVVKLFRDLMTHYELSPMKENDEQYHKDRAIAYSKCRAILDKANDGIVITKSSEALKREFNSDYMNEQINLMIGMQDSNPTEAIGKAKELIESCCKTILIKSDIEIDKDWDIIRLTDEVFKYFNIMPKWISDDIKGAQSIKKVLGNLKAISQGVAELRNLYGSGHGKEASYKGLEPRHARLAVGSSTTLVLFLWDSYQRNKKV